MCAANASRDDIARLRDFWDSRYQSFALSESGWSGAGESFNRYVYRCKTAAITRALTQRGFGAESRFAVLDAGCGQGYFADFYHQHFENADYVGLDLSSRVIEHLRDTRPGIEVHEGDLASWAPATERRFDVVQCLEVLHLILDDDVVRRALRNFRRLLNDGGVALVTVRPGEEDAAPGPYLRFRPESQLRAWWEDAGLVECGRVPMYYWMPDQGPRWRLAQPLFFRMPPSAIYLMDRCALALGLPRAATGPDSQTELVTLAARTR
jgi:SAM-dependent methyltransferase